MKRLKSRKAAPSTSKRQTDDLKRFFTPPKVAQVSLPEVSLPLKSTEMAVPEEALFKGKLYLRRFVSALAVIGVILGGGMAGFRYLNRTPSVTHTEASEMDNYLRKIRETVILPADEEPTLATVSDKEKLKDKFFFAQAENGDKVLVFSQSRKIILFRPSAGKIVEMVSLPDDGAIGTSAPVENLPELAARKDQEPEVPDPSRSSAPWVLGEKSENAPLPAKVAVYNGAGVKGLARTVQEKILNLPGIEAGVLENASGNYPKTVVIDLRGGQEKLVLSIIASIGGEAGKMPETEPKPEADVLVIAGKDQK